MLPSVTVGIYRCADTDCAVAGALVAGPQFANCSLLTDVARFVVQVALLSKGAFVMAVSVSYANATSWGLPLPIGGPAIEIDLAWLFVGGLASFAFALAHWRHTVPPLTPRHSF